MALDPYTLPALVGLLWISLHTADHALTLAVYRLRTRGDLPARIDLGGSIELNPRFRGAVAAGKLLSRPFLATLAAGVLILPLFFVLLAWAADLPGVGTGARAAFAGLGEALLGVLVVGRLQLVANHVQSYLLFRRLLTVPAAAVVRLRYDRGTVMSVSRGRFGEATALVALGAAVTGSPFLWGGVAGLLGFIAATIRWERSG